MHMSARTVFAATALGLMLGTAPAFAETAKFEADLAGDQEVPPTDSAATGESEISFDNKTMELTWTITYEGLSADPTAAHFHGPAKPGENAPPVIPVEDLTSPIEGKAILTAEQAEQLVDGLWYFNLHTAKFPGGEIRGQVVADDAM